MRREPCPWQHGVVLVCTNQRDPSTGRASCGRDAGKRLREHLKAAARGAGGDLAQVRVLEASCLDVCAADGVTVAFVPGDAVHIVDPVADRDALLEAAKAHFQAVAHPPRPRLRDQLLARVRGGPTGG
jgi:predicted metal-binding protein